MDVQKLVHMLGSAIKYQCFYDDMLPDRDGNKNLQCCKDIHRTNNE